MPPPSALTRSRFRSVIVSAWSKNQRRPSNGTSRLTASNTSRKRRDRLVVGGVQAERPAVFGQQPHHLRQLLLQRRGQVGPGFEEVLEVGRRERQHLAGPVHAVEVVALAGPGHRDPLREVVELLLGPLGEQVVGDADGHLAPLVQVLDDLVVVGVVLEAAARRR